jgi:hypothetical protein
MRQRLFTKEIDNKLFAQYKYGSDLSKQMVVAKIFNPFNRGQWYIINSDPNDPDYLWAIVDLFEIEAGSVSREDLQTIKVPPFGLNLERDLYFQPINAQELYDKLRQGERFEHGGSVDVIQNDNDESYLTSVNAKPTDAAIKLADGGGIYGIEKYLSKNLIDHISSLNEEQLKKMKKELLNEIERSEKYDKDFKGSNRQFSLKKELDLVNYRLGVEDKMANGGTTKSYTYVPKSDIKEIDAVIGGKEQKISGKDVLDGAYVKKSVKENYFTAEVKANNTEDLIIESIEKGTNTIKVVFYPAYEEELHKNLKNKELIKGLKKAKEEEFDVVEEGSEIIKLKKNKDVDKIFWVKKIPSKSNKGKLSERAQGILDSSLDTFENKNEKSRLALIKQVQGNLDANKKGIENIGIGFDEDMVAAAEEFLKIVKSKKYEEKPEIELGTFKEARYAKGKVLYIPPPTGSDNWKNRQMKLAEAKGISGKYTGREKGYIMSKSQAEKLKKYILEGYDASAFTGELIKPEDSYKKGGVTFKDKVKSISNSLNGKKVPSKLKKDYGATYDKKESVLAATRIAGAMKAKMESKKKKISKIDAVQKLDVTDFDKDGDVVVDMA